jgi:uncharacterized membrane protein YgcG
MKKILKMSDAEIDQNFRNLIKEKQLVALADYFSDKISDDHRPLDYTSPIRLAGEQNGEGEEGSSDEGGDSSGGDEGSSEGEGGSDEGGGDSGGPSFGLG